MMMAEVGSAINYLPNLRAKWISYKYEIPFFYKRFDYSTKLVLHKKETRLENALKKKNYQVVPWREQPIDCKHPDYFVYVCPYFPGDRWETDYSGYYHFDVDWKDKKFRNIVLKLIAPQKALQLIHPPKNTVNVAMHIREGGGLDSEETRLRLPMKLPPLHFYLDGFSKVLALFPDKPITCHIFTDAKNPDSFVQHLKTIVPPNVSVNFTCRTTNSHDKNVLEDFFSLFNFDCLIRPQSNFSIIPSLLHDYAVVYSPAHFIIEDKVITIDKSSLDIDDHLYKKLLAEK